MHKIAEKSEFSAKYSPMPGGDVELGHGGGGRGGDAAGGAQGGGHRTPRRG